MSRHGYTDDNDDPLEYGRWRARVKSAIRGKRGQAFFRSLAAAMDAMPEKVLVAGALQTKDGDCCTIGLACKVKGIDYSKHENDEPYELKELNADVAAQLNIAECLVQEIEYMNDEFGDTWTVRGWVVETPEKRWLRMRAWVEEQIIKEAMDGK